MFFFYLTFTLYSALFAVSRFLDPGTISIKAWLPSIRAAESRGFAKRWLMWQSVGG